MDEWDSIDWDEKVEVIVKSQKKQSENKVEENVAQNPNFHEDDGNYYEDNMKKLSSANNKQTNAPTTSRNVNRNELYIQPYSHKDLIRIRESSSNSSNFQNLIHETFGQFERFLMTHQLDLTHDIIVELLIIDVALLEIPFTSHNRLLLEELSKIESFWSQLVQFIKEFLEVKHKDVKFLFTVDMNGFFNNIETLLNNLLVNNLFDSFMITVFDDILRVLESHPNSEWSRPERLRAVHHEFGQNSSVSKIYDVSLINSIKSFD